MDGTGRRDWQTSSYTGANGGNCVEVGHAGPLIAVRDTKHRTGPALRVSPAAWRRFTGRVKAGT
jgi:Domain of unknown function (DUF397)